jgi:hypothetical protein
MAKRSRYTASRAGVTRWAFASKGNLKKLLAARDPVALVNRYLERPLKAPVARALRGTLKKTVTLHVQGKVSTRESLRIILALWKGKSSRSQKSLVLKIDPWRTPPPIW